MISFWWTSIRVIFSLQPQHKHQMALLSMRSHKCGLKHESSKQFPSKFNWIAINDKIYLNVCYKNSDFCYVPIHIASQAFKISKVSLNKRCSKIAKEWILFTSWKGWLLVKKFQSLDKIVLNWLAMIYWSLQFKQKLSQKYLHRDILHLCKKWTPCISVCCQKKKSANIGTIHVTFSKPCWQYIYRSALVFMTEGIAAEKSSPITCFPFKCVLTTRKFVK